MNLAPGQLGVIFSQPYEQLGMYASRYDDDISIDQISKRFGSSRTRFINDQGLLLQIGLGCQKPGVPFRTLAETRRGKVCVTRGDHVEYLGQAESDFDAQGQIVLSGELSDQRIIEPRGPITLKIVGRWGVPRDNHQFVARLGRRKL